MVFVLEARGLRGVVMRQRLHALVLAVIISISTSTDGAASANSTLISQRAAATVQPAVLDSGPSSTSRGSDRYHVLEIKARHGVARARGLLRHGLVPIGGSVKDIGYFYATIGLGTPHRNFDLIIDTGSTISYVPCSDCTHCGTHKDPAFDVSASSTAKRLGCATPLCNCGSPSCQCMDNKCYYARSYAEGSSSTGFLLEDCFAFPDANGPVKLVFGCESGETGEIFRQVADGILGMGNSDNAFQSQLVEQKVIADSFGLCFGYPSGGKLLLGDVPLKHIADMQYTALVPGLQAHYYTVILEGITVNGAMVDVPASTYQIGYGTVMDSGTTFTYLPTQAFERFSQAVDSHALGHGLRRTPGLDPQYNDICWSGVPEGKLDTVFPKVAFVFKPSVSIRMQPMRYLFKKSAGSYCLGIFDNGSGGTLIGGISVRDVIVQYDRRNNRIGFLETDCNSLQISNLDPLPPEPPMPHPPAPPLPGPPVSPPNQHQQQQGKQQQQEQQQEEQQQQGASSSREVASDEPAQQAGQSHGAAGAATTDAPVAATDNSQAGKQQQQDGVASMDGAQQLWWQRHVGFTVGASPGSISLMTAVVSVVALVVVMQVAFTYRARLYQMAVQGISMYSRVPAHEGSARAANPAAAGLEMGSVAA